MTRRPSPHRCCTRRPKTMVPQQSIHPDTADEALRVLADRHCRATATLLWEAPEETVTLETIAHDLSTQDPRDPERLASRLHHVVLPKLAEIGVVEYDREDATAGYRGNARVESLLVGIRNALEETERAR